jgi:hypothetical protein
MLRIPRITEAYIKDGLKNVDYSAIFEPSIGLNFHYPDCAFFALLMEIQDPKHILDLGSYFGLLPIMSEHLHKLYGSGKKFQWTLVDNCSYVKELADYILTNKEMSGKFLTQRHVETWKLSKVDISKQHLFEHHDTFCVPPTTPDEFYTYWDKFTKLYGIDNPSMEMYTNLSEVGTDKKFSLVMFDLASESFKENILIFRDLIKNYTSDNVIVVLDDIDAKHPMGMAMFNFILDTTDFVPVAFSTGKVAIQRADFKKDFIFTKTVDAELRAIGRYGRNVSQSHFNFFFRETYKWGDYLDMCAN